MRENVFPAAHVVNGGWPKKHLPLSTAGPQRQRPDAPRNIFRTQVKLFRSPARL